MTRTIESIVLIGKYHHVYPLQSQVLDRGNYHSDLAMDQYTSQFLY